MSTNKIIEALQESSNMKEFVAVFWRGNPQLKNGGYETERTIEAKTLKAAEKKAKEIEKNVAYGSMSLLRVEEKETVQESNNFKSRLEKIENIANEEVEEGSNFKSRLEKLDKIANESKVTEDDDVPDKKQYSVDEDKWITIKGTHVLTDDDGNIKNEKIKKKLEDSKEKKISKQKEAIKKAVSDLPDADGFDYNDNHSYGRGGNKIWKVREKLRGCGMSMDNADKVYKSLRSLNSKMKDIYDALDSGDYDTYRPEDAYKEIDSCKSDMRKAGLDDDSIDKILSHTGMDDVYM